MLSFKRSVTVLMLCMQIWAIRFSVSFIYTAPSFCNKERRRLTIVEGFVSEESSGMDSVI